MADDLLRRAAERAAQRPSFLAATLLPYARAEALDDDALARRLGCAPEQLPRLLLCRQPRPAPGAFRTDVERLADAFGLDVALLANIVRQASALARLAAPEADGAWLAAARDREADAAGREAEE
jgi:hypothetical protein